MTRIREDPVNMSDIASQFFGKKFTMQYQHCFHYWKQWKKCTAVLFLLGIIGSARSVPQMGIGPRVGSEALYYQMTQRFPEILLRV